MFAFFLSMHVVICILLVISVLLQAGRGGGLAGSFGGGGQALFGGRGAATFFSKATVVLGALFFTSSLALAIISSQNRTVRRSLVQEAARHAAGPENQVPVSGPPTTPAGGRPTQAPEGGGVPSATPGGAGAPQAAPTTPAKPQGK